MRGVEAVYKISLEEIYEAYEDCIDHKRHTPSAVKFEYNLLSNLSELTTSVNNRTYKPLPSICFVIENPSVREIFASDFRDRILQHWVRLRVEPLLEQEFITDTYSCRKKKGTTKAVKKSRTLHKR